MRTDINTNSKRGVIIEPMPGSASSSESSGMNRRPCPNRMNPSSDDSRWLVLDKILVEWVMGDYTLQLLTLFWCGKFE
jgi:hypothetical protein